MLNLSVVEVIVGGTNAWNVSFLVSFCFVEVFVAVKVNTVFVSFSSVGVPVNVTVLPLTVGVSPFFSVLGETLIS